MCIAFFILSYESLGNTWTSLAFWILIDAICTLYFILSWKWELYIISQDTLTHSHGVILRSKEFHSLESVITIAVKQGIIGLLFNFGNIRIYSPFSEEPLRIKQVPSPFKTAEEIEKILPDEIPIKNAKEIPPKIVHHP